MRREPSKRIRSGLISTNAERIATAERILSSYGLSMDINCTLADIVIELGEYRKEK